MEVNTIFSTDEIDEQTARILNCPTFKNSFVLSRFLEFIVAETVHKKEAYIKEYAIAIHVLGRARDFNPNRDSIVRIHAGRLRRALTDYYLTEGIYDTLIIQIPKGRYVPEFIASGTQKSGSEPVTFLPFKNHKSLLAIFPLKITTDEENMHELHALLRGLLSEELLKFHNISVIGFYPVNMKSKIEENILDAGFGVGADYIIGGNFICEKGNVHIYINLLVAATGEILLCKSLNANTSSPNVFDILDLISKTIIDFAGSCHRSIILATEKH